MKCGAAAPTMKSEHELENVFIAVLTYQSSAALNHSNLPQLHHSVIVSVGHAIR